MREGILEGKLDFPGGAIIKLYPEQEKAIRSFWKAVWYNYLNESETNGLHWYELLGIELYNKLVRSLSHHGWIVSNSLTGRRWASVELCTDKLLEYVTVDELEGIKTEYKYEKYVLELEESKSSTLVRQNGDTKYTGLVREGFMHAGNTQFGYDMDKLEEYEDAVIKNLVKSMEKVRGMYPEMKTSESSYDAVSAGIYEWHKRNKDEVFTTGENINDSRGRAISQSLRKVANPISNKDFRAALVITYED